MERRVENHVILGELPEAKTVTFTFDGEEVEAREGEMILIQLYEQGERQSIHCLSFFTVLMMCRKDGCFYRDCFFEQLTFKETKVYNLIQFYKYTHLI